MSTVCLYKCISVILLAIFCAGGYYKENDSNWRDGRYGRTVQWQNWHTNSQQVNRRQEPYWGMSLDFMPILVVWFLFCFVLFAILKVFTLIICSGFCQRCDSGYGYFDGCSSIPDGKSRCYWHCYSWDACRSKGGMLSLSLSVRLQRVVIGFVWCSIVAFSYGCYCSLVMIWFVV